jgi:Holliday junction resolvasome RuvABC ATP-dependent DNA helicase subunit
LGINPLGLNATEISILRYLKENTDGTSLTRLAAKTGFSKESIQRDYELFLMKHSLICIETSGRQITPKGIDYLKQLDSKVII